MTQAAAKRDRRHARHEETLTELVDVAVRVMAEHGVAGLSLGEVARRMGMRPPSLYVYLASKHALYDAIFARGWGELQAVLQEQHGRLGAASDLPGYLLDVATGFVRWAVEHAAYWQLMAWRPVPGYEPSPAAYAPAVDTLAVGRAIVATLRDRGLLRADVEVDRLLGSWTVLVSGVITQQLANAPHEPFDDGTFTSLLPDLVQMYLKQYGIPAPTT